MKLFFKNQTVFFRGTLLISLSIFLFFTMVGVSKNEYWRYIIYEKSPLGYYQALLLLSCCIYAFLNLRADQRKTGKLSFGWLILFLGFIYLTLDEKFALHENLREQIFKPNNFVLPALFWVERGDYGLLILMIIGLCLSPFVLKVVSHNKSARNLFFGAMAFSAFVVAVDSIDLQGMPLPRQKLLQYFEEIFELTAEIFYLNALFRLYYSNSTASL
jgi:hypothetical protein